MKEREALIKERIEEEVVEEEVSVEEIVESQPSMEELLEEEGLDIDLPKAGEMREGTIASISENEILVSIGAKFEGIIAGRELDQIDTEVREGFEVGDEIVVYVVNPEDRNGNLAISYTRAQEELDWEFVEELEETEGSYVGTVSGFNKGGLLVPIKHLRGFIPGSQISMTRNTVGDTPEARWASLVGEEIEVQVIEVDRSRRRLILSERQALDETRDSLKDRLLEKLEVGDICTGRVTSLANFGAFVNIEGADGLVHLSEISWDRIKHPKDVLDVGQEVEVKVISIDQERKRIGLSIRQLKENPWLEKVKGLKNGQLVEGTITHLTNFGAFARLEDRDLEGLIHISELSADRIEHPKEVVSVGDKLTLRIINIDREKFRIGLSIRKVSSGAYIDLDWKLVKDEVEEIVEDEETTEGAAEAKAEVEEEAEVAEQVDAEAEEEETPEAETEDAPEAEAEAVEEQTDEAEEETEESPEAEVEETPEAEAEAVEEQADEAEEEAKETPEAEVEEAPEAEAEAVEEQADEAEEETEESPEAEVEETPEAEAEAVEEQTDEAEKEAKETPEAEVEEAPEAEAESVEEEELEDEEAPSPDEAEEAPPDEEPDSEEE